MSTKHDFPRLAAYTKSIIKGEFSNGKNKHQIIPIYVSAKRST